MNTHTYTDTAISNTEMGFKPMFKIQQYSWDYLRVCVAVWGWEGEIERKSTQVMSLEQEF